MGLQALVMQLTMHRRYAGDVVLNEGLSLVWAVGKDYDKYKPKKNHRANFELACGYFGGNFYCASLDTSQITMYGGNGDLNQSHRYLT